MPSATRSPPVTPSAPPSVKSFWTSTMRRAVTMLRAEACLHCLPGGERNRRRRSPACGRFPRSAGGFVGEPVDLGELLGSAQTQLTSDNAADVLDQPSLPGGAGVETLRVEVEAAQV